MSAWGTRSRQANQPCFSPHFPTQAQLPSPLPIPIVSPGALPSLILLLEKLYLTHLLKFIYTYLLFQFTLQENKTPRQLTIYILPHLL